MRLALALAALTAPVEPCNALDIPNIVIVVVDDVGTDVFELYDEVNPYRHDLPYDHTQTDGAGDDPATSGLYVDADALASFANAGVVFRNAYAHPVCSPTRASMMSGVHPIRHGVGSVLNAPEAQGDLHEFRDPGFEPFGRTLPEIARDAGLDDCIVGKWHLGMPTPDMSPENGRVCVEGWDSIPNRGGWSNWACVFAGFNTEPRPPGPCTTSCGGLTEPINMNAYGTYYNFVVDKELPALAEHGTEHVCCEYATTWQFDTARDWCNTHNPSERFLCVITPNASHSPWDYGAPPALVSTPDYLVEGAFRWYASHVEAVLAELERFTSELEPTIRSRTIFIFTADNGTPENILHDARIHGALLDHSDETLPPQEVPLDLGQTYDLLIDRSHDATIDPTEDPTAEGSAPSGSFKSSVFEKGTRVPMIVWGTGIVSPGRTSDQLVQVEDVYATVADLLGEEVDSIDGKSFRWVLEDPSNPPSDGRDRVYAERFAPTGSLMLENEESDVKSCSLTIPGYGRFKLIRGSRMESDGSVSVYPDLLYRLQLPGGTYDDPFETDPLDPANYVTEYALLDAALATIEASASTTCPREVYYCESTQNSAGGHARICLAGEMSVAGPFDVHVSNGKPNKPCQFFFGQSRIDLPFGDGSLCVATNVVRLPNQTLNADGEATVTIDPAAPGGNSLPFAAGDVRHFQCWYRDLPPTGLNTSDAMTLSFCP